MTSARNVAPARRSSEARTVAPLSSATASYTYRRRLGMERGLKPATTLGNNTFPDNMFPDDSFPDNMFPDDAFPDSMFPDDSLPDNAVPDNAFPDNTGSPMC